MHHDNPLQHADHLPLLSLCHPFAGGTVQQAAESVEQKGQEMEKKAQQNQGKEQMNPNKL
jgi:hypothetical protein